MKIIDLTLPIYEGMPVYPGDPEVEIEQVDIFENGGWNMKRIHMNGHDGTHVNASSHCTVKGKTLDDYVVDDFCGDCTLFEDNADLAPEKGVIFSKQNITMEMAEIIVEKKPKFVGLSAEFEYDEDVEIFLLQHDIICFERLANTDQLPKAFIFHGVPLKIKEGDGSPIRAYAVC